MEHSSVGSTTVTAFLTVSSVEMHRRRGRKEAQIRLLDWHLKTIAFARPGK